MLERYLQTQNEILNLVLQKKDPKIISRKLGYQFNQVDRWVSQKKKLKWDEFIDLCHKTEFSIDDILENLFGASIRTKQDSKKKFIKLLLEQSGDRKAVQSALQKSRLTLYRLKNSATSPSVAEVLAAIDLKPNRLNKFIKNIKDQSQNAPIPKQHAVPWLSVVSSAMAQKEHLALPRYSADWIAKKVKLKKSQVELAVQKMVENELIEWNGNHYQPTMPRTLVLNHNRSRKDYLETLRFWSKKSLTAIDFHEKNGTENDRFAGFFRTFMTTPENIEKINFILAEAEEKIHNLLSTTEGDKTEIRSFLFTHFNVADTSEI